MTMYEVRNLIGLIGFPVCLIGLIVSIARHHKESSTALWMLYSFVTGLAVFTN